MSAKIHLSAVAEQRGREASGSEREGKAEVSASWSSGDAKTQMAQGTEPSAGRGLRGAVGGRRGLTARVDSRQGKAG